MPNILVIKKRINNFHNRIIKVSGDKSLSIRWVLLASLAEGKSKSFNLLNYEDVINKIQTVVKKQHHELIEDLAENIFKIIFQNRIVKKTNVKIEKLDIVKNSESVGIEFSKNRL